jgi:hypothetical protein
VSDGAAASASDVAVSTIAITVDTNGVADVVAIYSVAAASAADAPIVYVCVRVQAEGP